MCVTTSQYEISGKNSHLHSQKVFVQSMIYQRKQFSGTSSILAWSKSSFSCLPTATFLHYVSTIKLSDQSSIVRCCCCCFLSYFCTFSVFVHFSLFKKTVYGRGLWQGVHGPGPWTTFMDPVRESGPCTRSKVGVHGPLVHVLSSPFE